MNNLSLIEKLIIEGRQENIHQHEMIQRDISCLREELQGLKVWKAKVLGIAAGISGVVSAAGWLLNHVSWGG